MNWSFIIVSISTIVLLHQTQVNASRGWMSAEGGGGCQYNIILKPLSDYQYGHDGCQGHVSMFVQTKSCTRFQIKENQQHADSRRIKEQNASVFSSKLIITSYNSYSAETASLVLLEKLLVAAEFSNQRIIFSQFVWLNFRTVNTRWWRCNLCGFDSG